MTDISADLPDCIESPGPVERHSLLFQKEIQGFTPLPPEVRVFLHAGVGQFQCLRGAKGGVQMFGGGLLPAGPGECHAEFPFRS